MTVGEKIKSERLALGLSQRQLADRSGCTARAIGYWEAGQRKPRLLQLLRVANALGFSLVGFIEEVGYDQL